MLTTEEVLSLLRRQARLEVTRCLNAKNRGDTRGYARHSMAVNGYADLEFLVISGMETVVQAAKE